MDDVTALTQLVLHERQGRDRRWWDAMAAAFEPHARVHLSWIDGSADEFVAGSRAMAATGTSATHRLGPPVVDVVGDRALVEVAAAICLRDVVDGIEIELVSHARLLYRARLADRWRLTALEALYESDTVTPVVPGAAPSIDSARLDAGRPSYRWLTYVLAAHGHPVADDLPGDDRPASIEAAYHDAHAWLAGEGVAA